MDTQFIDDLKIATEIQANGLEFVLVRDGRVLASGHRHGIAEILDALERLGSSAHGAVLADHVVGRAVALLAHQAQLAAVHAQIASASAEGVLEEAGIPFTFKRQVGQILNQAHTGLCPFEQATQELTDPGSVIPVLRRTLAAMRKAA